MPKAPATTARLRGGSEARGPELAVGAALAAAVALFAAVLLPDAGAIDALACIKFYLAQGCLP